MGKKSNVLAIGFSKRAVATMRVAFRENPMLNFADSASGIEETLDKFSVILPEFMAINVSRNPDEGMGIVREIRDITLGADYPLYIVPKYCKRQNVKNVIIAIELLAAKPKPFGVSCGLGV